MPNVTAAPPIPTMPAPVAAATTEATAATIDFAALLLGQLSHGTLPMDAALADSEAVTEELDLGETAGETTGDPALLLAAMGLTLDPATRDTNSIRLTGGGIGDRGTTAMPGSIADGRQNNTLAGWLPQTVAGEESGDLRLTAAMSGSGDGATTAKFAGFEQKLAESLESATPPSSHPLTAGGPTQTTAARAGEPAMQHVATPVRDPAWSSEFGQKIVWMATQDRQNAQLTLNPPQMGPIEISLSVRNDQATAVFVSGNAEVREAIEAAMPRLREMLAGVGVELGQTNVSAESFRQAHDQATGSGSQRGRGGEGDSGDSSLTDRQQAAGRITGGMLQTGNGLVDTFA